jgi:hypothetical protein
VDVILGGISQGFWAKDLDLLGPKKEDRPLLPLERDKNSPKKALMESRGDLQQDTVQSK